MPKKKCGFGFSCASMMQQPFLEPQDCPNWQTCGRVQELTPEEEVELVRARQVRLREAQEEFERVIERFRVTRHQAAVMMLQRRGRHQSLSDFDLPALFASIGELAASLETGLTDYEQGYIAPEGVEAHRYNVKRPGPIIDGEVTRNVFWYNKLTANHHIFAPAEKQRTVRVIHLSKDDDPRNFEGRLGIERRNRLQQIRTQLQIAQEALQAANAIASAPMEVVLADNGEV